MLRWRAFLDSIPHAFAFRERGRMALRVHASVAKVLLENRRGLLLGPQGPEDAATLPRASHAVCATDGLTAYCHVRAVRCATGLTGAAKRQSPSNDTKVSR